MRSDEAKWKRIKSSVMRSDKGGKPGQWSAIKAGIAVRRYKAVMQREGKRPYKTKRKPTARSNSYVKWLKEDWGTKSGKRSRACDKFGKDHMPAIMELEERQESKRMRLFQGMKSLATQAGSTISFAIREAPGIMQAPFNSASRGLFCCVTVNTSYEN